MGIFEQLQLSGSTVPIIEWDMTPDLAFCTFSAKGLRGDLTNTDERVCYFFIDNWGDEPKLYLMERGVRHVHILAEIKAPMDMLQHCILQQGGTLSSRDNFCVDPTLRQWLQNEVVQPEQSVYLIPALEETAVAEDMGEKLPAPGATGFNGPGIVLPTTNNAVTDDRIAPLFEQWNFYDSERNPQGKWTNFLADPGDQLTVVDEQTSLVWQRSGLDLCSIRSMKQMIEQLNQEGFAGSHDWRLPSLEEALSLMQPTANAKGVHLPTCFSKAQPFIFTSARRKPTGYWFVDYAQGKIYWSSGTVPGGFARLCRSKISSRK
jgi:hypothetical protein